MEKQNSEQQLVPIGAVVELLQQDYPDVSHSSLRFLERERLIVPTRTPGGHRLFSTDDIQRVRQIKDWQSQRLTLEQIRQRLVQRDAVGVPQDLSTQFLERALAGDLENAQRTVLTASDLGLSLDVVLTSVLRPALWELGKRWERGDVSVAQEKEVSHLARDLIAELGLRASTAVDDASGGVVAACAPGERHELGLLMVSGLLRARGVSVHFLGADVDPLILLDAVGRRCPLAVLLSATSDRYLPGIREAANQLRAAGVQTRLFAGGQAVQRQADVVTRWGIIPVALDDLEQIDVLAHSLRAAVDG